MERHVRSCFHGNVTCPCSLRAFAKSALMVWGPSRGSSNWATTRRGRRRALGTTSSSPRPASRATPIRGHPPRVHRPRPRPRGPLLPRRRGAQSGHNAPVLHGTGSLPVVLWRSPRHLRGTPRAGPRRTHALLPDRSQAGRRSLHRRARSSPMRAMNECVGGTRAVPKPVVGNRDVSGRPARHPRHVLLLRRTRGRGRGLNCSRCCKARAPSRPSVMRDSGPLGGP